MLAENNEHGIRILWLKIDVNTHLVRYFVFEPSPSHPAVINKCAEALIMDFVYF